MISAAGKKDYTYVFRQDGADLIGTARSQDGVVAIANGRINNKTLWFIENVMVEGRRVVLAYTGDVVSDTEIRFKRQAAGNLRIPFFSLSQPARARPSREKELSVPGAFPSDRLSPRGEREYNLR